MKIQAISLLLLGSVAVQGCGSKKSEKNDDAVVNVENLEKDAAKAAATSAQSVQTSESQSQSDTDEDGPTKTCETRILDFDNAADGSVIPAGAPLVDQYADWGVSFDVQNRSSHRPDLGITFDSSSPTGGDEDLRTPSNKDASGNTGALSNLLIIAENDKDENGDGLVDDPDDNSNGGKIILNFAEETRVNSIKLIDIEESGGYIALLAADGSELEKQTISALGDNTVQTVDFSTDLAVSSMKIKLKGSSAVDDVNLCVGEVGPGKDDDEDGPGKDDDEDGPGKDDDPSQDDDQDDTPDEDGPGKDEDEGPNKDDDGPSKK